MTPTNAAYDLDTTNFDSTAVQTLKVIAYTVFGIVATVLAFVFVAPLGILLALFVMWRGLSGVYDGHQNSALRVLSLIGFTLFSIVATVMAFVFLAPAGILIAGMALAFGFGGFKRTKPASDTQPLQPTGNRAFDSYREQTLTRLEQERENFEAFLARLRDARDKTEFDQFMDDRARRTTTPNS